MAEKVLKVRLDFFDPEPNVPEPVLVHSEHCCYLIYNDRNGARKSIQFTHCTIATFGYPNDEALAGHRLYSKGLGFYGCFEIVDSEWIEELKRNNKVSFPHVEGMLLAKHFVFTFSDSTFECIARDIVRANEYPQLDNAMLKVYGI